MEKGSLLTLPLSNIDLNPKTLRLCGDPVAACTLSRCNYTASSVQNTESMTISIHDEQQPGQSSSSTSARQLPGLGSVSFITTTQQHQESITASSPVEQKLGLSWMTASTSTRQSESLSFMSTTGQQEEWSSSSMTSTSLVNSN